MTEDRLTHLLAVATDLPPSDALQGRIATPRPGIRRGSWFVLSGATVALAVALLLALPRESAAGLLQKAEAKARNVSARFRMWDLVDGREQLARWGMVAGAWRRFEAPSGRVELYTPTTAYVRDGLGERTLVTPRMTQVDEDDLTLDEHLKVLRQRGYELEISMGESQGEGEGRTQEIQIDMPRREERETLTLNAQDLPIQWHKEALVAGRWRSQWRAEVTYPGPKPGADEFWTGIDGRTTTKSMDP